MTRFELELLLEVTTNCEAIAHEICRFEAANKANEAIKIIEREIKLKEMDVRKDEQT